MNPNVESFKEEVEGLVGHIRDVGCGREGLLILAEIMQGELVCDTSEIQYPHALKLDLIMRAVMAVLKGPSEFPGNSWSKYVFENLDRGVSGLKLEFK